MAATAGPGGKARGQAAIEPVARAQARSHRAKARRAATRKRAAGTNGKPPPLHSAQTEQARTTALFHRCLPPRNAAFLPPHPRTPPPSSEHHSQGQSCFGLVWRRACPLGRLARGQRGELPAQRADGQLRAWPQSLPGRRDPACRTNRGAATSTGHASEASRAASPGRCARAARASLAHPNSPRPRVQQPLAPGLGALPAGSILARLALLHQERPRLLALPGYRLHRLSARGPREARAECALPILAQSQAMARRRLCAPWRSTSGRSPRPELWPTQSQGASSLRRHALPLRQAHLPASAAPPPSPAGPWPCLAR